MALKWQEGQSVVVLLLFILFLSSIVRCNGVKSLLINSFLKKMSVLTPKNNLPTLTVGLQLVRVSEKVARKQLLFLSQLNWTACVQARLWLACRHYFFFYSKRWSTCTRWCVHLPQINSMPKTPSHVYIMTQWSKEPSLLTFVTYWKESNKCTVDMVRNYVSSLAAALGFRWRSAF